MAGKHAAPVNKKLQAINLKYEQILDELEGLRSGQAVPGLNAAIQKATAARFELMKAAGWI